MSSVTDPSTPALDLDFVDKENWPDALPAPLADDLSSRSIQVFRVDPNASDTAVFSQRYGFGLDDCANTIIVRYKVAGGEHFAALVGLGSRRLDVNGAVKKALEAKRLSFARAEEAAEFTQMEFGGITAFGLPKGCRVLVDAAVMDRARVVMGAGFRNVKLLLAPSELLGIESVSVLPLGIDA
jgi:prolyl-tRNA editing enzyme YbaK/EbsC (Cys-tRNA(Pro) deacylase)